VIRAAVIVVLVAAAAAWTAYEHLWRYGDAHPLAYRLAAVPNFEATHPLSRVTTRGKQEHVLITAGPRSSTGYSLEIERAVVERGRVSIVVREVDRPGRAQITYPYRLLVFPKIDKPVHIHWEGRT
jgi:PrcB C-terminal